jgi:hypothetical protein
MFGAGELFAKLPRAAPQGRAVIGAVEPNLVALVQHASDQMRVRSRLMCQDEKAGRQAVCAKQIK